ncbi:thioredoxin domain-containing protein [Paenibacillus sp. NFR01]|uniref:thioredoxin domain-containing protein n=1 Tax=Paenibacillus sp. NFR01 TaxID=1566279 RepID=UPI0008ACF903|nr:thioredoxin domain-containing protein [Paenibacillus sp. NFR01]SET94954.1 Protein-disulfide isomerase [Paenibacillus sp. NFR01]
MKKRIWIFLVFPLLVIVAIESVVLYQQIRDKDQAEAFPTFMDAKGKLDIQVGDFKLDKQPSLGKPDAPVKVIEFVDFKCPACKAWEQEYSAQFKKKYIDTGIVQFFAVNFPFLGPDSIEAALAAELMYEQGADKFWQFKQKLYDHQGQEQTQWATESFLLEFVKENIEGIDYKKFEAGLKNWDHLIDVKEDFKIASANGVYGTPSFRVNGKAVSSDYAKLSQAIEDSINNNK